VLMRGLAANLAPNSWRQEGHAFFLALFTRSCRVERLWVARQGSVRRFQGRRDRCSLPSFVGGALLSQHGSWASGCSVGWQQPAAQPADVRRGAPHLEALEAEVVLARGLHRGWQ
jgi:hypothetical protein